MRHASRVPLYMDRHEFTLVTAEDIAAAHLKDLEVQGQFGVQFLNYWFDEERQHAFCLATGPSGESVEAAHGASHGMIPYQVIEVDPDAVMRFMGGMANHRPGEPYSKRRSGPSCSPTSRARRASPSASATPAP